MTTPRNDMSAYLPTVGCLSIFIALLLLLLMPLILVDLMSTALERLHLSRQVAALAVFAIIFGGLVNIPVYRLSRTEEQLVDLFGVYGYWGWFPRLQRIRRETIIAVNLGGCVVPLLLAAWQVIQMTRINAANPWMLMTLIAAASIFVCYRVARPVEGIGIMMPGFAAPLTCVGLTWLLLPIDSPHRVSVAFVAGVLGPLVGADLLHLKDITRISTGMLSIGGAGTFDGIVLSGVLAALLA